MIELCCYTKDGIKLESCQTVTLYREGGYRVSGRVHYFGHADGDWRLSIEGPGISTLYHDRRLSMKAARKTLVKKLAQLDAALAKEGTQE